MIDRYTKAVLTVIALALSAIAVGQFTPQAHAQPATCGGTNYTACYIRTYEPLEVNVTNEQINVKNR